VGVIHTCQKKSRKKEIWWTAMHFRELKTKAMFMWAKQVCVYFLKSNSQIKLITNWIAWERGLRDDGVRWNMSIKQSKQVSMATLRAATVRHCQTNRISGDTYHHQQKGGRRGSKSMLEAWIALKANCTFLYSWQAKHVGHAKSCMRPHRAWLPWNASDHYWLESNFA